MSTTPHTRTNRTQIKRLDGLIALPLARFRTAAGQLSLDELAALERRIEQMTVKQRWALGGHGIERHRAPNELELLARRLAETRREVQRREKATSAQLRLIEFEPVERERIAPELTQAA